MSMREYTVKEGAVLRCTLGTKESILQVPKSHGVTMKGGNQATITDRVGNVNIMPFCNCMRSLELPPCTPEVVIDWINGKQDFTVDDELALLNICIVPCIFGGVIEIVAPGQDSDQGGKAEGEEDGI